MIIRDGRPTDTSHTGRDRARWRLVDIASRRAAANLIGSGVFALLIALSQPHAAGALAIQRVEPTSTSQTANQVNPLSMAQNVPPIEVGAGSDRSRPEPGLTEEIAVGMTSSSPPLRSQPAQ